jgi:hypothetical protein
MEIGPVAAMTTRIGKEESIWKPSFYAVVSVPG